MELLMHLDQLTWGQPETMTQACIILGINLFPRLPAPRNYRPPHQLTGQERADLIEHIKEQFGGHRPLLSFLGHVLRVQEVIQLTAASS
jgi:hypothetical protein